MKTPMKLMQITAILLLLAGIFTPKLFGQSTVYVFTPETWVPIPIKINNQEAFEMRGTPKGKNLTARHSACYKKCTLPSEGKVIFSFDYSRVNQANTDIVYQYADEIQLNLTENSVHYIAIRPKGLTDCAFKELDEKKALKLLNKKKYISTAEYIQPQ